MAACTSRAAESILRPLPLFEVISLTPEMTPRRRSSGVATLLAIVSGLAPGSVAETEMVG